MTYTNFQIILENLSGSNGRNLQGAVINSFEIYTINSLMEKKKIETDVISKALFWVAQPKQKKIEIIVLPTSAWPYSLGANFFQFFVPFFTFFSSIDENLPDVHSQNIAQNCEKKWKKYYVDYNSTITIYKFSFWLHRNTQQKYICTLPFWG